MIQYDAVTLNTELDYFFISNISEGHNCSVLVFSLVYKYFPEYSVYGYSYAEELWDDL